jgi:excisionase family DNA binding protein
MRSALTRGEILERRLRPLNDAAAYAGCSRYTLRRRIADGTLTGYRLGPRLISVDLNEIDATLRPIPTVGSAAIA